MSLTTNGRAPGALYELVARGNKDKYLMVDAPSAENPFNPYYHPVAPRIPETRTQQPLNAADFGRPVEFAIETFGDILASATVLIDLPTWFTSLPFDADTPSVPPRTSILENDWQCTDDDASGVRFGYTNGIGYFLFERIQIFQDRILLSDITGDSLQALTLTESSYNQAFLNDALTGRHDGSARAVGLAAAPGQLRLRLPFPGTQHADDGGWPLCATRAQNFRVRLVVRRLEDIVEGSDGHFKPNPWGPAADTQVAGRNFTARDRNGITLHARSLAREQIGRPTIQLETTQLYIAPRDSAALAAAELYVPYRNYMDQEYTFNEPDYAPLDKAGGIAPVVRRLEGRHPVERVVWYIREEQALAANQRWNVATQDTYLGPAAAINTTGQFYGGAKLVIAGQDREDTWEPAVWQDIEAFAKDERDCGRHQNEIRWSLGAQYERETPAVRQLEGAVNFSTADRPTLQMNLQNILHNPLTGQRATRMQVCTEQWAVMEVKDGRCRLLFAN